MPSRADTRRRFETALRAVSIAILGLMLWLSLDRGRAQSLVSAGSADLGSGVRAWSMSGLAPDEIRVRLDRPPQPSERDWLAALRGAGSSVMWSGDIPVTALSVMPVASPRGGFTVLAAAPGSATIRLSDDVGPLDTAIARNGGATFSIPSATGVIRATTGLTTGVAALPDSARVRRVLVIGNAGWESKFTVAALEEDGWRVDADLRVAPGVNVTQGSLSAIDTSRYSAVIVLDGAAASRAPEITRYVASGGGLILAGSSAALDAFSGIRPGVPGKVEPGSVLHSEPGSTTLLSLPLVPAGSLRSDVIPLDRRNGSIAAVARRHGTGRVLQQGYVDTWRWRMSGGDDSPGDHRAWWTRAVASVAYSPSHALDSMRSEPDNAPFARLVASLGTPSPVSSPGIVSAASSIPLWLLFAILAISLPGEWASRRLRGLR
jgi:hypothetical protein